MSDSPTADEREWIEAKLVYLNEHGIQLNAPGTLTDGDRQWFRQFLKDHGTKQDTSADVRAFEKLHKFKLPKSYKDFIGKVGPYSFKNVDEQEGNTVHVVAPNDFNCKDYRSGTLEAEDDQTNSVDGVMFALADHGDCFCFDVRNDQTEFEVFLYLHEFNCFEPYAPNFAACIRRFVAAANGA